MLAIYHTFRTFGGLPKIGQSFLFVAGPEPHSNVVNHLSLTYLLRFLFFGGLVWVVLFNLSANPSVDAVAYTRAAATGQDLVYSHHLLHTLAGHYLWKPLLGLGMPEDLPLRFGSYAWLAWSNGLAYLALALGLNQMLVRPGQALHPAALAAAASWGLLRYAVEFEAYLWPLLLSLLGVWAGQKQRWALAGLALAAAFLFHQLALVWVVAVGWAAWQAHGWAAFKRTALGLWLVPLVYVWVYVLWPSGTPRPEPLAFVFGEFTTDGVKTDYAFKHVLLTAISGMRAWVQVHGYQWILFRQQPNLATLLGMAGGLMACLVVLVGWVGARVRKPHLPIGDAHLWHGPIGRYATWGLLAVGLWSQGNAEFMAGLPVAIALGWAGIFARYKAAAVGLAGVLMGWNVAFGLLPQNLYQLYPWQAEADVAATPGLPLATYHKLEVDVWCWVPQQRPVLHAQWLQNLGGQWHYDGRPLPYTTLLLEQMPTQGPSRAAWLETQQGAPANTRSRVEARLPHLGGPTTLLQVWPLPSLPPGRKGQTRPRR